MWMPESGQNNDNANEATGGGNFDSPPVPGATAAAAAAQAPSAKELESKPRPTRPLSAYNLFFQAERKNMLDVLPVRAKGKPRHSHGKIGFADLARKIAAKWKALTKEDREPFDTQAAAEKKRYAKELKVWKREQEEAKQAMRREHELMVQARTGMLGGGGGIGLDPGVAGLRSPTASGVLQLPSTTLINRGNPVQAFDEHPGMAMQHPYQPLDPAMLSNNTAPRYLDTSARQWNPSNQSLQQAQQASLFAQERQRAFQQDAVFARNAMMGNTMGGAMGGMGSGSDFGLARQGFTNQFGMGGNQAGLMDPASDISLLRQYAGNNAAFQGQGLSPLDQLRNSQQAAAMGNMMNSQLAAARMGGSSAAASWNNSFAAGGAAGASSGLGLQQQQNQQQQAQNPGGHLTADEMARYLRGHFGA